jgi:hypothetical protein
MHDHRSIAWSDERDPAFDFLATNVTIFSAADRQIIGHARYSSSRSDDTDLIRVENKYLDGARDITALRARLRPAIPWESHKSREAATPHLTANITPCRGILKGMSSSTRDRDH